MRKASARVTGKRGFFSGKVTVPRNGSLTITQDAKGAAAPDRGARQADSKKSNGSHDADARSGEAPAPPAPVWYEGWHEAYGCPYYHNVRTGESRWEMPDHPFVPCTRKDSSGAPASALNGAAGSATHCGASSTSPQAIQATGSKPNRHRNAVSRIQRWLWCFSILGIHLLVAQHVAADVPLVLMAGMIASVTSQALPISTMNAFTRCSAAFAIFLLALRCRNRAEQMFGGLEMQLLTSSALEASGLKEWRSLRHLEALFTSLLSTAVAASDVGASVPGSERLAAPNAG